MNNPQLDIASELQLLCDSIDHATELKLDRRALCCLGFSNDSVFYKAISRKAKKFDNIEVYQCDAAQPIRLDFFDGLLLDTTQRTPQMLSSYQQIYKQMSANQNIDCQGDRPSKHASSCVAAACYLLLRHLDLCAGKTILIVGRGPATTGLADLLIKADATVTVVHTKTKQIPLQQPNIVINTAPKLNECIGATDMIIDVGGAYPAEHLFYTPVVHNIGKLTTSILLGRL